MKLKKHLQSLLEQQTTADLTRMANTIKAIKLIRRQKLVAPTSHPELVEGHPELSQHRACRGVEGHPELSPVTNH